MSMFGDLVRRLRKERGMTLEQVARRIDSHKGYVSGIENGKVNPPSVKLIRKFARLFRHDEKEMVKLAYVDKAPRIIRSEARRLLEADSGAASVPLMNTVATGYPTELNGERHLQPRTPAALVLPHLPAAATAAAVVVDESMQAPEEDALSKGDVVLLAPEQTPRAGAIALVVYNARNERRTVLRRIQIEQNRVVLQPLNKAYPLESISQDDINAIYRVAGRVGVRESAEFERAV